MIVMTDPSQERNTAREGLFVKFGSILSTIETVLRVKISFPKYIISCRLLLFNLVYLSNYHH